MALVVPGYTPTDATTFNANGWGADVWSTTNGVSINGELNGHIQNANFAAGEELGPRHVRPGEGFRGEYAGTMETVDVVDLLFGSEDLDPAAAVPVPGTAKRVYVPWNASAVLYTVSCYVTNFRMRKGPATGQDAVWSGPEMLIKVAIDGVQVDCSIRKLPYTCYPEVNPGYAQWLFYRENLLSHHFDMTFLCCASTRSSATTKGFHDVVIKANVPTNTGYETMYPLYDTDPAALCDHDVMHRIRFGIRSASVLCFP